MSENKNQKLQIPHTGIFSELTQRIKLILRLMSDSRVSPLLKLLPVGALVYLIWPADLLFGPVDDAVLLWVGTSLFVELCPPQIVEEHQKALTQVIPGQWRDPAAEEDVVDAEYWREKPRQG